MVTLTLTLEKTPAGLGFSLEGGRGSLQGDRPLTVNRVFSGASATLSLRPSGRPSGRPAGGRRCLSRPVP